MNQESDPLTATGNVRAVLAKVGTVELAIAFIRMYWKPLSMMVGAVIAGTTFVVKVDELRQGQAKQEATQERMAADLARLEGKVDQISLAQQQLANSQLQTSTALQTLFDAAKIDVRPEGKVVAKRR